MEKKENRQGFTIVELLVVVGIIVLMTALVLPNWRAGEQSLALERSAQKLRQDIRRTIELALRAEPYPCAISGYGLYFSSSFPNSYILYAECGGNEKYDSEVDKIVGDEAILLESGVEISSVSPSPFSILFVPPTPDIAIQDDLGADFSSASVTLRSERNHEMTKVINISDKGVIEIQ